MINGKEYRSVQKTMPDGGLERDLEPLADSDLPGLRTENDT